jgi:ribosomal protein S18 acetylase RimI-like enzyme
VTIRPATSDDIAFIESLVPRLASKSVRPSYYTVEQMVDGTRSHLRDAIARSAEDELFIVAIANDSARVGLLWANTDRDYFTGELHGYIEEVAVSQDGAGAGRALMEAAEAWAKKRGYRYVSLSVRPANLHAKSFYARRGYELEVERLLKLL